MPEVVDWHGSQPGDLIDRAVQVVLGGGLVAFPSETFYQIAANANDPAALARLQEVTGKSLTLAVTDIEQMLDWIPTLCALGRRLVRRSWPGPITLMSHAGVGLGRLPVEARSLLCPRGLMAFRAPAHEAMQIAIASMPGSSPLASVETAFATAEQVTNELGEVVSTVINGGPTYYQQNSTVVRVAGSQWQIESPGVVPEAVMETLAACQVLFICTGNTCRSPLAQALCAKLLADRLGCAPNELSRRGFIVHSAGLLAMMGGEAASEAVEVAKEWGADLTGHRSQPLTGELLAQADYLITMTRAHLNTLVGLEAHGGPAPRLLCAGGEDIPDPIGAATEVYRECARQIVRNLEGLLPELQQQAR